MDRLAVGVAGHRHCAPHSRNLARGLINHRAERVIHGFLPRHKHRVAPEDHPTVMLIFLHRQQTTGDLVRQQDFQSQFMHGNGWWRQIFTNGIDTLLYGFCGETHPVVVKTK